MDAVGYEKQFSSKRERVFEELMKLDMQMVDRFTVSLTVCVCV